MNTTDVGRLGEIKVAARLVELGWYVFTDVSGKCSVDLIAWKDGISATIQIKTTTVQRNNSYPVQIGRLRNNTKETTVHKFNPLMSDYLAVYIVPLDKVCFVKCSTINQGRTLTFKATLSRDKRGLQVQDFQQM